MRPLLGWLRAKGVISKTPLHALRKQFGSEINAQYGLLAASEQLRHGGIAVTARHYVENRSRSVVGFGHLLKGERTIIPIDKNSSREVASWNLIAGVRQNQGTANHYEQLAAPDAQLAPAALWILLAVSRDAVEDWTKDARKAEKEALQLGFGICGSTCLV